ncbi:MAG: glycosyl hydrolase family 18 protein [Patescibacteria group bacterium]
MKASVQRVTKIYTFVGILFGINLSFAQIVKQHPLLEPTSNTFSVLSAQDSRFFARQNYVVYGFLPYWSVEHLDDIQVDKLTDIAYFALSVNKDGSITKITSDGTSDPGYEAWRNNKELDAFISKGKDAGVRFSITVISHISDDTDYLLMCESCWDTLAKDLIAELRFRNLSSVNLDFEYATYTEPHLADQYTKLATFIKQRLDAEFGSSYVVVSTFADAVIKPRVTKVDDLAKVVDALFIMAYDFRTRSSESSGPSAPIDGAGSSSIYDIRTMLRDYLATIPPTKLILGVPYYGNNYLVESASPMSRRIEGNDAIGYSETQTYADITNLLRQVSVNVLWDDIALTPYFNYNSLESGLLRQVYFENAKSLSHKYDLAVNNNLAGVGIWALGYDGKETELWELLHHKFIL